MFARHLILGWVMLHFWFIVVLADQKVKPTRRTSVKGLVPVPNTFFFFCMQVTHCELATGLEPLLSVASPSAFKPQVLFVPALLIIAIALQH